jgi:hypothetical protein
MLETNTGLWNEVRESERRKEFTIKKGASLGKRGGLSATMKMGMKSALSPAKRVV